MARARPLTQCSVLFYLSAMRHCSTLPFVLLGVVLAGCGASASSANLVAAQSEAQAARAEAMREHDQLLEVKARLLELERRSANQTRPYGSATPIANSAGYEDYLDANSHYTGTRRSIGRPQDMSGTLTCTAFDGDQPVSQFTAVGQYPIKCSGETRSGFSICMETLGSGVRIGMVFIRMKLLLIHKALRTVVCD